MTSSHTHSANRSLIIQAVVALVILGVGFFAVSWSDASLELAYSAWTLTIVLSAVTDIASGMIFHGKDRSALTGILPKVLHWVAVFVAVQIIYSFVNDGEIDNAITGLVVGVVVSMGQVCAGVRGNWRMAVLGLGLTGATLGIAYFEHYIWTYFAAAIVVIVAMLVGITLYARHKGRSV